MLPAGVSPCDVGWEVRRLRLAVGWTQDELARRAATSQPAIAYLESGRRMPMLSTLQRLAAALGRDLVVMLPSRESNGGNNAQDTPPAVGDDGAAVGVDSTPATKSLQGRSMPTGATA